GGSTSRPVVRGSSAQARSAGAGGWISRVSRIRAYSGQRRMCSIGSWAFRRRPNLLERSSSRRGNTTLFCRRNKPFESGFFGFAVPLHDFPTGKAQVIESHRQWLDKIHGIVVGHDDLHLVPIRNKAFHGSHLVRLIQSRGAERVEHSGALTHGFND